MTVSSRVRDVAVAGAAATASLLLYTATLQPDFGGPEDTPKFQFVGYVLGTPHPPGYPLYILLSHLFVMLPAGTIAWRANLFSAVMASIACSLTYAIGRQAGARRWSALCAAAGLATGAAFWRSAVFAEVYGLAAVMAALVVALLLDWGHRGGTRRLVAAFGAFAFALGNHLTIVGVVPAFAGYVLTRGRRIWSVRMLAASAFLLLLGLGQYGLIVVRTRQEAPYLETRAAAVRDLPGVIAAERFAGQRFAFGPAELLTNHLPATAAVIVGEFGLVGTVLFLIGAVTGIRRADLALVLGAAAGMFAMILNISGDLKGFVTPLMVLLWPAVALGIDQAADAARRVSTRPAAGIAVLAAAAIVPAANLVANYAEADQSRHAEEAAFLRAAFERMPDGAGFVPEDYWSDMAWHYYRFTGEAGRHIRVSRVGFDGEAVRKAASEGRRVFAFARATTFLAAEGVRFRRVAVDGPPLDQWLSSLPRGSIVLGATAYLPAPPDLAGIGHSGVRPQGRPRAFEVFAAVVGLHGAAWRGADEGVTVVHADRETLGSAVPAITGSPAAIAGGSAATIELAGQTIAWVDQGIALAVFAPNGVLLRALELPPGAPPTVPFAGVLYEAAGESACAELTTEGWTDVGPVLREGGWIATLHAVGSVSIETTVGGQRNLRTRVTSLLGAGTIGAAVDGDLWTTELARSGEDRPVFRLALDRPVLDARARVRPGGSQASVRVCASEPVSPPYGSGPSRLVPDFESEPYFGAGWSDAERSPTGPVRHGGDGATLFLRFAEARQYRVSFDLAADHPGALDVSINGRTIGSCDPQAGRACDLIVPAESILPGVNRLAFSLRAGAQSRDYRFTLRGARIRG